MESGLANLHITDVDGFEIVTSLFASYMETVLLTPKGEKLPEVLRKFSDYPERKFSFDDAKSKHEAVVAEVRNFLSNHTRVVYYHSNVNGDCDDCGNPAAFKSPLLLCAICAANRASDGDPITRL